MKENFKKEIMENNGNFNFFSVYLDKKKELVTLYHQIDQSLEKVKYDPLLIKSKKIIQMQIKLLDLFLRAETYGRLDYRRQAIKYYQILRYYMDPVEEEMEARKMRNEFSKVFLYSIMAGMGNNF